MSNLFKGFKNPQAHVGKTPFDLSQKHCFSSKIGQLLPVLNLETVPSDHFEIDLAGLIRSLKMNTAAYVRGKFHFDFFFVPYSQIWHPFNQFITTREDRHDMNQKSFNYVPNLDLGKLLSAIYYQNQIFEGNGDTTTGLDTEKDIHNVPWHFNAIRLLDLCGYGDFSWVINDQVIEDENKLQDALAPYDGKKVNIFRLAAYQHIFYDVYRNKQNDLYPKYLSNGNVTNYWSIYGYTPAFNFDDLQCNTLANAEIPVFQTGTKKLNPRVAGLFDLHYHQYKADIFTSTLPSMQFGAVSSIHMNLPELDYDTGYLQYKSGDNWTNLSSMSSLNSVSNHPQNSELQVNAGPGFPLRHNHVYKGSQSITNFGLNFDVLALKRAEALQNWKQNVLRAGNQVDDNFNAHFGVEPYYEGDNVVRKLGSFECQLNINPVIATSTTAGEHSSSLPNTEVGEMAATGVSVVNGERIEFDAKDFGVIVCIETYVPETEYKSNMIDKSNRLIEPFDFFTPEFDNLGMDVVSMCDYSTFIPDFYHYQDRSSNLLNVELGYVPAFAHMKTAVDKVHGEFNLNTALVNVDDSGDEPRSVLVPVGGSLCPWVAPREEDLSTMLTSSGNTFVRNIRTFYITPNLYDKMFGVYANEKQNTDCFLHNVFFKVSVVRPMSLLGLPYFN